MTMKPVLSQLLRWLLLVLLCTVALQIYFLARVALMAVVAPQSTTFQRSEISRLLREKHQVAWSQQWVDRSRLAPSLKRAVIASEDAGFAEHSGVEWDALEQAWEKNQRAQAQAERLNERLSQQAAKRHQPPPAKAVVTPKIVGGSTITQQLAKNLFLAGERSMARKAQEFIITFMLEATLPKARILEIYLNHVEWGEGVFGAEAAAQYYFRVPASNLSSHQAARLAVMLPAPKRFEKRPASGYLLSRAATVQARMAAVELP